MNPDDFAAKRQAQATSHAVRAGASVEWIEDARELLGREAGPTVSYIQPYRLMGAGSFDFNPALLRSELDRVIKQIAHDAIEIVAVTFDRQSRSGLDDESLMPALGQRPDLMSNCCDHLSYINDRMVGTVGRLDSRQREQIFGGSAESFHFVKRVFHRQAELLGTARPAKCDFQSAPQDG